MASDQKIKIKKPEGYHCFACGTDNPIGLNLEFYANGDKICSEITPGKYHVGWADIATVELYRQFLMRSCHGQFSILKGYFLSPEKWN